MPSQNLISATLVAEKKARILKNLTEIRDDLDFLMTLLPDEIKGIYKAGNGYLPFIEKAYYTANEFPEILPQVFKTDEFMKDYHLAKDLVPIFNLMSELTEGLRNTIIAAYSDALSGALEIYAAVKQHRNKVPGLNVVAEEMRSFFKRRRRRLSC